MVNINEKIKTMLAEKKSVVVAIDGRSASGKSTLADGLAVDFDGMVIRMDHFFLPMELRGEKRVNVHYERFLEEVYPFIKQQMPFSYRVFDCSRMDYHGIIEIIFRPLIIIEGVYSQLPYWDDIIDLRVFCDIDAETQKERIINRNGLEQYKMFRDKWIPLEEAYFKEYDIKENCDVIIGEIAISPQPNTLHYIL